MLKTSTKQDGEEFVMRFRLNLIAISALALFLVAGCSTVPPRNAAPDDVASQLEIAGVPDARFWGDEAPERADERIRGRSREELQATLPAMFGKTHNYLAISGGGRMDPGDYLGIAERVGADRTLVKPFDIGDLIATVDDLLAT